MFSNRFHICETDVFGLFSIPTITEERTAVYLKGLIHQVLRPVLIKFCTLDKTTSL